MMAGISFLQSGWWMNRGFSVARIPATSSGVLCLWISRGSYGANPLVSISPASAISCRVAGLGLKMKMSPLYRRSRRSSSVIGES